MRRTALWIVLVASACGRPLTEAAGGAGPGTSPPNASPAAGPLVAASDADEEIRRFEARAEADPRNDADRVRLAESLLRRHAEIGDCDAPRRAEAAAREALALEPASMGAVAARARALSAQGRTDEALGVCRAALGLRDGDVGVLSALAEAALDAELLDDARAAVELLLSKGETARTLTLSARLHRLQGDAARAAETARRAAGAAKREGLAAHLAAEAHVEEGRALLVAGEFDDAARAFDAALTLWPRCADAWLGRAGCDTRRDRPAEALAAAERAAAIRPGVTERAFVVFLSPPGLTADASPPPSLRPK